MENMREIESGTHMVPRRLKNTCGTILKKCRMLLGGIQQGNGLRGVGKRQLPLECSYRRSTEGRLNLGDLFEFLGGI